MFEANPNWLWGFLSSSQLLQLMCLFDRTQSWQNYVQSLSYWKVQQDGQWCGTWKFQMWKMPARISRVSMEVHSERSYCGCHKLSGNYALCNKFNLVTIFLKGISCVLEHWFYLFFTTFPPFCDNYLPKSWVDFVRMIILELKLESTQHLGT